MEYTDTPVMLDDNGDVENMMHCSSCGHLIPKAADACDRCDWVRQGKVESAEGQASDAVAVLLSVIPGLGHIYKGHKLMGLLLMFAGTPVAIGISLLAAMGTAGFGLGLLPLYWFGVMFHAYTIPDRVLPSEQDEGEQF